MSDGFSFDFTEVTKLAADIGRVPKNVGPNLNSALQFTATRVKKDAAKSVGKGRWSAAAAAIDYAIGVGGSSLGSAIAGVLSGSALSSEISAEVGYNKGKAGGPLGNIREFGAPGKDTAPSNDLVNALHENEGDFQKGLEKAVSDAERKAGL
ncbi:hypothetical protein ASE16_03520 [Leifsonia sp. Root227]|uniref:hypothetical protein n=1 Tax=Leifsonia sp. Root227 TaxID=1736496 RepID=UPI00070203E8|nr:hypothetical protein [Leifsonia sp. Root227]KRC52130.1 hypothetical protein ASE16_03520 [Leifsonia sp. Root227]